MATSAGTPSSLLRTLDGIAREAAVLILEVYATKFSVDFKAPRDPVTEADRRANELICDRLSKLFPNVPIVAEESEPETFAEYRRAERIFFVDPLDGTREFVARNGEFVVMIGYVEGDRPAAAVIHAPESGISWLGEVGSGAYQLDPQGAEKPITVSALGTLSDARIVGSRSHRNPALERALGALGARELVALGSAGLKASVVAHGAADAYVAPHYAGKRWDACAAEALINAAGGKLTDSRGDLIDYRSERLDNDRGVVASNGLLHDTILEKLESARS
ncbi:MAG TPA: inositol monophosphatase family protein [Polyangiaceae bacterium]|nr:inositol monophosphatase family protein [Polyangiaceae bacterium]